MAAETEPISGRVKFGQDHFNSLIEQLDDSSKELLDELKAQLEKTHFNVIGQEKGGNPEVNILVNAASKADIPFPFIDFVILNSIPDEGQKQLRLMLIHDTYISSMLYPEHSILCMSQGFDLTEGMPYGTPVTGDPPEQIAL